MDVTINQSKEPSSNKKEMKHKYDSYPSSNPKLLTHYTVNRMQFISTPKHNILKEISSIYQPNQNNESPIQNMMLVNIDIREDSDKKMLE